MPDKPIWFNRLDEILNQLSAPDYPSTNSSWCQRHHIEALLGVGRRRAQQILGNCATSRAGRSLLVDKETLRSYLSALAADGQAEFSQMRYQRLRKRFAQWNQEYQVKPPVFVEAPISIQQTSLHSLPPGVELSPPELRICFTDRQDLLKKLLALALALGKDDSLLDNRVSN
ncbi:hypothetical protein WDZ92_00145 [Nostoc sp. NIES-2111]